MHSSKINCPSLIAFLLITIRGIESLTTETIIPQQDQSFWQLILRDFVFRTVASPQLDDILYKNLLDAPFYGGPLRETFDDDDALLSIGNVYRMSDGRWIFCQDNCEKCEVCEQNGNSTVKWILKRVKRRMSSGRQKWDLQLTVLPQLDEEPRAMTERIERGEHLAEMEEADRRSQKFRGNSGSSDDSIAMTVKQPEDHSGASEKSRYTDVARFKRYRPKVKSIRRPSRLALHRSPEEIARINRATDIPRDDWNPRLIMGIDQHGEKHLVHVVPIDSPLQELERSGYPVGSRGSYQTGSFSRISRKIPQSQDEAAYLKLIDRIFDSLKSHRNIIETFLFSDRLEKESTNKGGISSYSSYPGEMNEDERFDGKNEPDYRGLYSPRVNRYPVNSEYQIDEQDDSYRRYTDMTRDTNRHERGKQIDDYEAYGMSANDRGQDERSLPRADAERIRRDYFGKLTDSSSIFGHELLDEYTERDTTNSGLSINRKMFGNLTDQTLENSRLEMNQSEPRIENFPVETATVKLQTDESDGSL